MGIVMDFFLLNTIIFRLSINFGNRFTFQTKRFYFKQIVMIEKIVLRKPKTIFKLKIKNEKKVFRFKTKT